MLVHGFDQMDEITICDNSHLIICKNGKITNESIIDPSKLGFTKCKIIKIQGQSKI